MEIQFTADELARLNALYNYHILDTDAEAEFDDFTLLAAQICGTPISLITLIDAEKQWIKSAVGFSLTSSPRSQSFCAYALHQSDIFLVPDAKADVRFNNNLLVTGDPHIRFYAGAPLLTADGHALGTLCVIDHVPRTLTAPQQAALQALSRQVVARLELRLQLAERTRAEQARKTSEALKAAILQSALDCIVTINQSGQILEWNPAAAQTFGYSHEEAIGQDLGELIVPPVLRTAHRQGMAHYLLTGEGPVLNTRIEITAQHADGREFPVELAITPIAAERETLFTATLRDITARKNADSALQEAHGKLQSAHDELEMRVAQRTQELSESLQERRNIMETVPDILFRLDLQGRLVQWNRKLETVTGLPPENLRDKPALELFGDAEKDAISHAIAKAFQTGSVTVEGSLLSRDGSGVPHQFSGVPLQSADGQIIGLTGMGRDITERKIAEESIIALNTELIHAYDATIEGWSRALDLRDHETEGHSRRVTEMTMRLAEAVSVPAEERVHIRRGALLHDIGKMGVPDRILLKPGLLNEEELEIMRRHPALAREMLFPAKFLHPALDIPYCHHEKWDGSGYPQGLRGEEIPLSARLFAIVDVWDALSSDRPYRSAWPNVQVLDHIHSLAGTHFDPALVSVFLRLIDTDDAAASLALSQGTEEAVITRLRPSRFAA